MKRNILNPLVILSFLLALSGCKQKGPQGLIMTVNGPVSASATGIWLPHEHILVDFIKADSMPPDPYDRKDVVKKMLPYLREVKKLGCRTIAECTPEYIGRDPLLLKELADSTGLNILTNTGIYAAHHNLGIPKGGTSRTAEEFAVKWISEFRKGIKNTGIKPGFIKIAVDPDSLTIFERRIVRAAAITHLSTGLTIASHSPSAIPVFQELDIIRSEGVLAEAFIWVHACQEKDVTKLAEAARRGAWISLDKVNDENINEIVKTVRYMKSQGLLHKVLLSHDAGWYDPAKPDGGEIRGYSTIFKKLIPALKEAGISNYDIKLMTETNPARAFSIGIRQDFSVNKII